MSAKGFIYLLVLGSLLLAGAALAQAPAHPPMGPSPGPTGLHPPELFRPPQPHAVSVEDVKMQSASLQREVTYRVLLPGDYEQSGVRYPVLYLLHGLWGAYTDWDTNSNLRRFAGRYPVIIVLPEGRNSWYTNAEKIPQDRYEDFLIKDLIPDVEKRFRTLQARPWRAVAGLSMGGYGAMKFALRRPDLFAFAGSLSGALDMAHNPEAIERWKSLGTLQIFGEPGSATRSNNDVFSMAEKAEVKGLPFLYLACGTEDQLMYQANRDFIDLLQRRHIPHEYRELPGAHTWDFWDEQIAQLLEQWWRSMPEGSR